MKKIVFLFLACLTVLNAQAQTYAERLGFPAGKKVIIFHVDDAGMSYDSNQGTIQSLESGVALSTSVMMPCGWVPEFFAYVKTHPGVDAGVHLTLTSEWDGYRWQPLTGREKAPGLYDEQGSFWHSVAQVVTHASADEVEAEIRAQIARFRAFGVEPTHLDSHMGTLFQPKFIQNYVQVGIAEKIPVMFPGGHNTLIAQSTKAADAQMQLMRGIGQNLWNAGLPVLDDLHADSYGWTLPAGEKPTDAALRKFKTGRYIELLKAAQPGLTMIICHATAPTEIFDKISNSGATRKGDLLAMTDPELRKFIEKEGIILTTWRDVMQRRKAAK